MTGSLKPFPAHWVMRSSLTGSQKAAPWQQHVGEDGHIFCVELTQPKPPQIPSTRLTDAGSACAFCSTRSCCSCASEDTGYSSDTDIFSMQFKVHRLELLALDLSHESLFDSKTLDIEDKDDGVSVDLLDFDKSELASTIFQNSFEDEELRSHLVHKCNVGKLGSSTRHQPSCTRTASLCERHSNKLSAPENSFSASDFGNEHKTCKCGEQLMSMLPSGPKPQDTSKEVILHLRLTGQSWGDPSDGISWLETMLGILPGYEDSRSFRKQDNPDSNRIIIKSLVPEGSAIRSKKLFVGDCIESINGKRVTWSNLNTVLSSLHQTKKVRLAVTRQSTNLSSQSDRLLLNTGSVLQRLLYPHYTPTPTPTHPRRSGEGLEGVCVLYMSMEGVGTEEEEEKKDVVYQFPKGENVLSPLRGSFYTLEHLLSAGCSNSDVRMLTVGVDRCVVNAACHKEGKDMLIITAPAIRFQSSHLLTTTNSIIRLVRLLYGSVEQAFSSEHHHAFLDDFLSFTFATLQHSYTGEHTRWQSPLLDYMDYLPLPDDIGVCIGNTLTEYESADFADMSDSFYGCRRSFTVLGSMAFYKGRVTCCHLSPKDAGDVGVYLKHSGLLDLSTRHKLHQMLVWREVFPTRLCHEVATLNSVFGYSEPHARWFLMVVGVNNTLLACILEAGGCSTQHEGIRLPDPFYVDQARAALLHLQTPDIISACEIRLSGDGLPAATTADKLLFHSSVSLESNHRGIDSFLKTTSSVVHSLQNPHLTNGVVPLSNTSAMVGCGLSAKGLLKEQRKMSIESDGSGGSGSSIEGMFKTAMKRGRLFPVSTHNALASKPGMVLDSDVNTCKLNSGKETSLLMFCQVNEQEGVLVTSPMDKMSTSAASSLHQQVVDNFCHCVTRMHADFALTTNARVYHSEGVLEDVHRDQSWNWCQEEGVMFTCCARDRTDSKKSSRSLVYWVVGRKFKNLHSREVYVCFQDSTPQHIIELAFRLALGSLSSA